MSEDCLFCRIVAGDLPARVVGGDERALAILDVHPDEPGHTLVLSRRHVPDLVSDPDALAEVARAVTATARTLIDRLGATGVNALVNSGASAGQEVFHLHVHLVPRGVAGLARDDLDAVHALLAH